MSKKETPPTNAEAAAERDQTAEATVDTSAQVETDAKANGQAASEELEALRRESKANLDGWQRTLAEFQNYKKRTERETRETYQNAQLDVIKSLLPIIDDFERALQNSPQDSQGQSWMSGITLIHRKFQKVLEDYNVTILDPKGQPFDPNLHQAVGMAEETDVESGHVAETLAKGYALGDRVLRPAIVKVAP